MTCPVPGCGHSLPCPWHKSRRRPSPEPDDDRIISKDQRRAQVLALLTARAGSWVPGPELATAEIGGSEGLRRVRELREPRYGGYKYECRRMHGSDAFEYRLIL